MRLPISMYC